MTPFATLTLETNRKLSTPMLNRLTNLADDYDGEAGRYDMHVGEWNRMLADEMRRAAAQLRYVRTLLYQGAMSPRRAGIWIASATAHLARVRNDRTGARR